MNKNIRFNYSKLPLALRFMNSKVTPLLDLYGHFQAPASFRRFLPPCIVHPGARPVRAHWYRPVGWSGDGGGGGSGKQQGLWDVIRAKTTPQCGLRRTPYPKLHSLGTRLMVSGPHTGHMCQSCQNYTTHAHHSQTGSVWGPD